MNAAHRKVIRLAGLGAWGILGANTPGFAADDKAARRRLARLQFRARLAFGIPSKFGSTSARPTLLGIALGASLGQAWRQLRRYRQRHALAELDDRLLRDIGVMRERD